MDFYFWGVVKDNIFERKLNTVDELKGFISQAFMDIDANQDLCLSVTLSATGYWKVAVLIEDISITELYHSVRDRF